MQVGLTSAGVLALLDPSSSELPMLMIQRHRGLRAHPGQIGLPGGAQEQGDGSLWQTALREALEEVAVPPTAVLPLGYANPVQVQHTGFLIAPVVATLRHPFVPVLSLAEVEAYFWMPLRDRSGQVEIVQRRVATRLGVFEVPGYLFEGHFVWGATGMIVDDLRRRLGEPVAGPPEFP
ncbi:MAG: NUDIX hydrolase [Candidatus Dormibacteria bacterium]